MCEYLCVFVCVCVFPHHLWTPLSEGEFPGGSESWPCKSITMEGLNKNAAGCRDDRGSHFHARLGSSTRLDAGRMLKEDTERRKQERRGVKTEQRIYSFVFHYCITTLCYTKNIGGWKHYENCPWLHYVEHFVMWFYFKLLENAIKWCFHSNLCTKSIITSAKSCFVHLVAG